MIRPGGPDFHHRHSIRLQGYDYSQRGAYFVTLCVQGRQCLLGEIVDGQVRVNDAGRMVERWWRELENKYPSVRVDAHVVMPNHFHGIVMIVGADLCVCPGDPQGAPPNVGADLCVCLDVQGAPPNVEADLCVCPTGTQGAHTGAPLPEIIQWFKTMATNEYIRGVKQLAWPHFANRLWQRNYYEHVIRNDDELNRAREYIAENPLKWSLDRENPANRGERL